MSRFRIIRSKGKFYVVTTDSNGLAGGPYDDTAEAQTRADRLAKLEEAQAQQAAAMPRGGMRITPGYRSPDVEDARGEPAPAGPEFYPPWMQRAIKWNGVPKGQMPPPDWAQPQHKHHLPIDPNDLTAEGVPFGEAERRAQQESERYWQAMAKEPQIVGVDLRNGGFIFDKPLDVHAMAKQAEAKKKP